MLIGVVDICIPVFEIVLIGEAGVVVQEPDGSAAVCNNREEFADWLKSKA